ncbi:MAG: cardiolipin synthase ClsB [Aquincola tertiaricarbonis]|uniref:cardiolipin synthase ClsB n=1 Tax=Aquincola tertiaricarbonis TaxID=391953 RepID=UPI000695C99B|nr:cardiolipin synthase ClsB [Aquincola tertiaricarbonis]
MPDPRPHEDPLHWYSLPRALFTGGNEVELLRGGDMLFPAMCEAIGRAMHEVWLATYIFHDDSAGQCVMEALEAAARRGVRVRVVVDGFGSAAALPVLRQRLESAGVGLVVYRPMAGWRSWMQPDQFRRLHQKLCVVDSGVGYVGGINVLDDRHDLGHGTLDAPRLDFAVRVQGPVVLPIEHTVRAVWTRAAFGRDWRDEAMAAARSPQPVQRVREIVRRMRLGPPVRASAVPPLHSLPPVRAAFVVRDNLRQRRAIERAYIDAFRQARERIDLVSPYFYPGLQFRRTLRNAARRGVKVRLLLQGRPDYRFAALAASVLYAELLAQGVRIYEYMPAFLHAKVAVVDDHWATVGSSNIDPLSLLLNLEANVVVHDRAFASGLAAQFDEAVAASREVTAPSVRRGVWANVQRGFVAGCARLYLRVGGITGLY